MEYLYYKTQLRSYKVYEDGSVESEDFIGKDGRNYKGGKVKSRDNGFGYEYISLGTIGIDYIQTGVHRIVAMLFVTKIDGKDHVNHLDGNKKNNHYTNLAWCTPAENIDHSVETGLHLINLVRKKVMQFNPNGELLKVWDNNKLAAKEYGITREAIESVLHGKSRTAVGYYWVYECDYDPLIHTKEFIVDRFNKYNTIKLYSISDEGEKVLHNSINDALRYIGQSISPSKTTHIRECTKGIRKKAFGYKWEFMDCGFKEGTNWKQ